MTISENTFSLNDEEFIHSSCNYDELIAIILFIGNNNERELSVIDFLLKIPLITKWKELTIEQNLYFLEKIKILEIERIIDSPPRKYKFRINHENFNVFKKMTDRTFQLECDYTIEQFSILLNSIETEIKQTYENQLIQKWRTTIIDNYSRYEQKDALIQKRNVLIEHYNSERNPLKFYDISNIETLSKKLKDAVLYREKIPLALNPNIIFRHLLSPINNLRETLKSRFYGKLQIDTINQLIENQELALSFIGNNNSISPTKHKANDVKQNNKYYEDKQKVDLFDAKLQQYKDKTKALNEFRAIQKRGFSEKTLERCIKNVYGNDKTINSYANGVIKHALYDKMSDIH